jgi:hypothetical protein
VVLILQDLVEFPVQNNGRASAQVVDINHTVSSRAVFWGKLYQGKGRVQGRCGGAEGRSLVDEGLSAYRWMNFNKLIRTPYMMVKRLKEGELRQAPTDWF